MTSNLTKIKAEKIAVSKKLMATLMSVLSLFTLIFALQTNINIAYANPSDDLEQGKTVTVARILIFQDTKGNILGRQSQELQVSTKDSTATFPPFAPISPQLPNYRIVSIKNNVRVPWTSADNVNYMARPNVYVIMEKVNSQSDKQNAKANNDSQSSKVTSKEKNAPVKKKKVKKTASVQNRDEENKAKKQKANDRNLETAFMIIAIILLGVGVGLIVYGSVRIYKNKHAKK